MELNTKKNVKEGLAVKWGCGWEILTLYGFASIEYFQKL